MTEIKLCPFCGSPAVVGGNISFTTCSNSNCSMSDWSFTPAAWNNRPAEAKIKAEAVIDFANYVDRVCTRREFILQTAKGYAANLLKDRNKLEQGE